MKQWKNNPLIWKNTWHAKSCNVDTNKLPFRFASTKYIMKLTISPKAKAPLSHQLLWSMGSSHLHPHQLPQASMQSIQPNLYSQFQVCNNQHWNSTKFVGLSTLVSAFWKVLASGHSGNMQRIHKVNPLAVSFCRAPLMENQDSRCILYTMHLTFQKSMGSEFDDDFGDVTQLYATSRCF